MPRGLPDRSDFGELSKLQEQQLVDMFGQWHDARRAKKHLDLRVGTPDTNLFSWAVRKGLPDPGQKHLAMQQPVHDYSYGRFQGTLPTGYGAGTVRKAFENRILLTKVAPDRIDFSTADSRYPERYTLIRPASEKPRHWLLVNTTPTKELPYQKIRFERIPSDQVESAISHMANGDSVQAKIDGAHSLVHLLKDRVEVMSYRKSKVTGYPIAHTERVAGGRINADIPPEWRGSVLRGELFGTQPQEGEEKAIPPQTLGGLLNSGIEKSRAQQQSQGIRLQDALFDIQQKGRQPIDLKTIPYAQRRALLHEAMKFLPPEVFRLTPEATNAPDARTLWENIQAGKEPTTHEGVVIHPTVGIPRKAKLLNESDVHLTGVFPGAGKYQGQGAGGFEYALEPGGKTIGRVGTGLSDVLRRDMLQNPDEYIGRVARVRAQGQFPGSNALRAPSLLALHEDQ